jgi:uncharacterized protein
MAQQVKILSIDGGGIRGVIPAAVLAAIEERAGKPIAELFDLIAGTSTGGILALALTIDDGQGRPLHSAAALQELYLEHGVEIFPPLRPAWARIARGAFDERYPEGPLVEVLRRYMGEARLKDALRRVMVTAYEIELRQPFFFRSARAAEDPGGYDFPVWQAARATAAAPTYFEAARIPAPDDTADAYALVDGGVYANNPAMCALTDLRQGHHAEAAEPVAIEDVLMVSLGTGELNGRIPWEEARDFGFFGWGRHLLGVVMDGVSDAAAFQCEQFLEDRYYRFQTPLEAGTAGMDDASQRNLEALDERAKKLVAEQSARIDEVCELVA